MSSTVADAHRLLREATVALRSVVENGSDDERLAALRVSAGVGRQLTVLTVDTVAELQRRGAFVARGYKSVNRALVDQLGFEWAEARRHTVAVEQVCPRVALDGAELPALLPASSAASRASPDDLAVVEAGLARTAAH
ncbi:hypothetical protein [Pseudonocardia sp. GCM10023141]|uniref:hypothetical protein n=1 Tax=Pseudonocardia sp. GCM10023141 TaxID=3252653 RepID=UPI003615E0FE